MSWACAPVSHRNCSRPAQLLLLDTFANQIALALEPRRGSSRAASQPASRRSPSAARLAEFRIPRPATPLATIAGAPSALQQADSTLDSQARAELTDSIVKEAERLNDLIANLMFATRLEAGGIDLRRDWTTVEEIVGAGLSRHREALSARSAHVHIPPDLPLVRVDNAMLPQVVYNLVDNALRYTPAGTPIDIAAWATDTNIVVKVADEGPGLSDEETTKVFERFFRGRAARSASGQGGIGLGLTISEGIVKAHGGRIWAERNKPRGVVFYFSLPIERPQPQVPKEASEAAA